MKNRYKYIIVGAGIAGCSVAHFLSKYSNDILLIDKNSDVASEASGAAGAFLSPLLGKPNLFKDLVTKSLKFSTEFYSNKCKSSYYNCGVERVPKDSEDEIKFQEYIPYMDFEFEKRDIGYFFEIGALVNSFGICDTLSKNVDKLFNAEIKSILYKNGIWLLNDAIECENLILTTGHCINLIDEKYLNIRAVWGQRINIESSSCIKYNYHKECSVSKSFYNEKNNTNTLSIGATHHRFRDDSELNDFKMNNDILNDKFFNVKYKKGINSDTDELINKALDILDIDDIVFVNSRIGARASSIDYFPMVGEIINAQSTLDKFPYIKKGSLVPNKDFIKYEKLFILNGVGGRGFVLSPYLANILVENIVNNRKIEDEITLDRLFLRWARKIK